MEIIIYRYKYISTYDFVSYLTNDLLYHQIRRGEVDPNARCVTHLVGWLLVPPTHTCPACSNRIMTNRSAPTKCIKINALSLPTSSQRTLHVYTCLIHISPRNLPPSLYTPVVSSTPWSYSSPSERKAACATKSTTTIVLLRFARGILLCCWGYVVGWRRSRFLSVSGERLVLR